MNISQLEKWLNSHESHLRWASSLLFVFTAIYFTIFPQVLILPIRLGISIFALLLAGWVNNPVIEDTTENFLVSRFGKRPTFIAGYALLGLINALGLFTFNFNHLQLFDWAGVLGASVFLAFSLLKIYTLVKASKAL